MGTDADGAGDDPTRPVNITLSLGDDGEVWVARDQDTGVASQGSSRKAALENLDEAVAGYHGAGTSPTDDDLAQLGIDPDQNTSGSLSDSDVFE